MGRDKEINYLLPNDFYGIKYNKFNINQFYDLINSTIRDNKKIIIYGYSLLLLPKIRKFPEIYYFSNSYDFFVIDGRGLFTIMKLANIKNILDLSLPDAVEHVLKIANENNYSILLFGATKEINTEAILNINKKYNNIKMIYGIDGYNYKDKEEKVIAKINQLSTDIIFIGISSPEKERIAYEWKDRLNCKIIIPCGGVIDILGGKTKREPKIIKKLNLTWLYRFIQEPKRLFKSIFLNGITIIFTLLPSILYYAKIKKKKNFSIPQFYGIDIKGKN